MSKWYAAQSYDPGDNNSVQQIPNPGDYTELVTNDICLAAIDGVLSKYTYDSTATDTEELPRIITPTGNSGNGRWILDQTFESDYSGFDKVTGPPTDSTISFTDGTRTFSVQPTGTSFSYYIGGVRYDSTGATVAISDVEGLHWIYFDTDGVLKDYEPGETGINLILDTALVGNVSWDATNNESILVGDERHGRSMSPATHLYLHDVYGAVYESGLGFSGFDVDGSGADATAAQFDLELGEFHDEDLEHQIAGESNVTIPTLYKEGVGGLWRRLDSVATYPVADGTIDLRLDWNDYNGGTWQLQEVPNNDFVCTHYFATNDPDTPIVGIMGEGTYGNARQARSGAETEILDIVYNGLPLIEWIVLGTVIWQTSDSYSNQVAARIRSTAEGDDYIDWRQNRTLSSGGGGVTSDHEALDNLLGGSPGSHYHLTETQHDDLTDGGDTTLHDHDGISENSAHRTGDGSDHADVATNTSLAHTQDTDSKIIVGNTEVAIADAGAGQVDVTVDASSILDALVSGIRLGGANSRVTTILDEDNMATDSATALATQQSIKAYVDSLAGGFAAGTKMYFYQNTAPTTWTIDGTVADRLLAVKGGTAAYNTTGGTQAGSWSPTNHTHTGPSHTHTMDSHVHTMGTHVHTMPTHFHKIWNYRGLSSSYVAQYYNYTGTLTTLPTPSKSSNEGNWITQVKSGDGYTPTVDMYTRADDPGDTNSADPGDTNSQTSTMQADGTGATGGSGSPSTDRPYAAIGIICSKD